MSRVTRRDFVTTSAAATAALWAAAQAGPAAAVGRDARNRIYRVIESRHDETIARLRQWIAQPSIAAENIGMAEGAELMKKLALDAGFQHAEIIPTKGHPGVFATLDAGAPKTLGLYFMYDVKQADPAEWSSPPWEAKLLDKPGFGKILMGRAATNQKAGRVFTATSTRSPPGVSKRKGPQRSAAPPRRRADATRPTVLATGWPVFSAIR